MRSLSAGARRALVEAQELARRRRDREVSLSHVCAVMTGAAMHAPPAQPPSPYMLQFADDLAALVDGSGLLDEVELLAVARGSGADGEGVDDQRRSPVD